MKSTTYLLIGNGLASSEAAKRLRERDPEGSITMVGAEPYVPYDRPPLSKEFLRGEKSREDLFFNPETYFREHRVDLRLGVLVEDLGLSKKRASLAQGESIAFEKALIATGGRPIPLDIPGHDRDEVTYLRTLDDAAKIADRAQEGTRAVIIGAGFIGMEVAASLTQRGVRVTVLETQPHIWSRFADPTLAGFFQDYCTRQGITFLTGEKAVEIGAHKEGLAVKTETRERIPCHFVCIGVGIVPNTELAQKAGLEVDNGIVVDEFLQSSHPDIFAAGDVAHFFDPVFGKRRRVEHWGHAEYCGQLAGENMRGEKKKYDLLTYVWSDLFDLHLEFAGDETEHDRVLVRGKFRDESFTVLFLKEHRLRAYFAVNTRAKEFPHFQRLIREKRDLTGKEDQLQDPSFPIKEITGGSH